MELAKHGTVGILEKDIQQYRIDTHQHVLSFVSKVRQGIAVHPDKIIQQRQNQDFQKCLRYPDKPFHIFIGAPAQLFHNSSAHPSYFHSES